MHSNERAALVDALKQAVKEAAVRLEPSLMEALVRMKGTYEESLRETTEGDRAFGQVSTGLTMLSMILENLEIASRTGRPMCQDTGMLIAFVSIGPDSPFTMHQLEQIITETSQEAFTEGSFRYSIVDDPLFDRVNTRSNLPILIHWDTVREGRGDIRVILKGFGSENCSAMKMFNPTATEEEIVSFICEEVKRAGGKPCPPVVLGVGIGSSAEGSALLAKKALLRDVGTPHRDSRYAAFERRILAAVQETGVGPGGFGGPLTALGVSVEYAPTHIAGLPVSLAISCWADRKGHVSL